MLTLGVCVGHNAELQCKPVRILVLLVGPVSRIDLEYPNFDPKHVFLGSVEPEMIRFCKEG